MSFVIDAGFASIVTSAFEEIKKVSLIAEKSVKRSGKERSEGVPPPM